MKKKLDVTAFTSSLRGESVFFPTKHDAPAPEDAGEPIEHTDTTRTQETQQQSDSVAGIITPRHHDTVIPRHHETTTPSSETDLLEEVRKAVKHVGKEAATQRLTLEEKHLLADIEYSYKRQGIRTSGNEIMRIATNYIIRDFRKNGENSVLAKIIRQLNA